MLECWLFSDILPHTNQTFADVSCFHHAVPTLKAGVQAHRLGTPLDCFKSFTSLDEMLFPQNDWAC